MAKGKQTCKILKEIRRQIAAANDINLVIEECHYKGDCLGTCPRCEAEVRYLEEQLRGRRLSGRAVALAGISAGMILMAGCITGNSQNLQMPNKIDDTPKSEPDTVNGSDIFIIGQCKDETIIEEPAHLRIPKDKVFEAVEEMPQFPGGEQELMKFINDHLIYPKDAAENGIEGRVVVKFVVKADGTLGDVVIVRSKDHCLDAEAIRIVKMLPNFIPGRMNGTPVNVWFTLPVSFKLKK